MSIDEKARDYKDDKSIFFGVYRDVDVDDIEDAFIDGAQWMQSELIEKAVEWFTKYLGEIGYPDDWLRDSKVQQSGMERFRKAMEE